MPSITITRALSKIKTLTSQVEGDLKTNLYITTTPNNMIGSEGHTTLVKTLISNKESLDAKLAQVIKLKKLIAESNLNTTVVISEQEMSVTEALAMKETMELYSKFYITLRKQHIKSSSEVTHVNERIQLAVSSNTSEISSSSEIKNEDLEQRLALNAKQLQESMGTKIVAGPYPSPEEYIEAVKDHINNFVSEIDYILSEHNSTTLVELD